MKKTLCKLIPLVMLCCIMLSCLASCNLSVGSKKTTATDEGLWANATYKENTTFGTGAKTITVTVEAGGKSVVFTIKTDKATLGDAMMEHQLLAGDQEQYGLYVKVVNGIEADYDKDQSWWGLYSQGEMLMTGVDTTDISNGDIYEIVRNVG